MALLDYWKESLYFDERRVRVIKTSFIGREGHIITKPGERKRFEQDVVRIAFDEFWTRPDGKKPEDANDNGWFFEGEWEYVENKN